MQEPGSLRGESGPAVRGLGSGWGRGVAILWLRPGRPSGLRETGPAIREDFLAVARGEDFAQSGEWSSIIGAHFKDVDTEARTGAGPGLEGGEPGRTQGVWGASAPSSQRSLRPPPRAPHLLPGPGLTLFPPRPGPPPSPRPPRRPRQERTVYSKEQQQELESSFQTNKYPTYEDREALAARLALQERQVQVWFKNRRAKESRPRGRGARAVPRGPGAPAPPRVPVPVPAGPPPPEGPGLCSPPPPSAASIFPPAEPSICSPGQAWWGPAHGAQDVVPAAPAPAPAWPHDPYASDFSPDPVATPDFTALF
nr:cone-rod homeobox protein-like [Equus asinus]